VVAPRTQHCAEAHLRRGIGIVIEPAEVDHGAGFARGLQLRRDVSAKLFSVLGRSPATGTDNYQTPNGAFVVDEQLGAARRFAVEPLTVERIYDRGLFGSERLQRLAILA